MFIVQLECGFLEFWEFDGHIPKQKIKFPLIGSFLQSLIAVHQLIEEIVGDFDDGLLGLSLEEVIIGMGDALEGVIEVVPAVCDAVAWHLVLIVEPA